MARLMMDSLDRTLPLLGACLLAASAAAGQPGPAGASRAAGIAARYAGDRGIAKDAVVVFADDFESWPGAEKPPQGTWGIRKRKTSRTSVVPGKVTVARTPGPGRKVLEIACWTEGTGSQTGGVWRKLGNYNHAREGLGNGYDELYIRYYIKFDEDYRAVRNHGANLGGRDVTRSNAAWVGMAAIRDVSSRGYFFSGVQPRGKRGGKQLEMGFYSYHLDKKTQWGEGYPVQKRAPIDVAKKIPPPRNRTPTTALGAKRNRSHRLGRASQQPTRPRQKPALSEETTVKRGLCERGPPVDGLSTYRQSQS